MAWYGSDTCKSLLLATLERVFVLSESQLILKFVFFKLVFGYTLRSFWYFYLLCLRSNLDTKKIGCHACILDLHASHV